MERHKHEEDFLCHIVKFNTQTAGRDKLCRLFQYTSKFAQWYVLQKHLDPEVAAKLKRLENAISMTRKVLRFGKSFDLLHSSLSTIHISDTVLRLTITLSHINQALYLLVDHIVWASKIGLIETQRKYWSKLSARFWLVSLILNLTRNIYDISNLVQEEQKHLHQWDKRSQYKNGIGGYKDIERKTPTSMEIFQKCLRENHPVAIDTAKNFCDLLLPLSSLGFVKTSKGLQGILGMISSYLSILTIWNPDLKLQNP